MFELSPRSDRCAAWQVAAAAAAGVEEPGAGEEEGTAGAPSGLRLLGAAERRDPVGTVSMSAARRHTESRTGVGRGKKI